MKRVHYTHNYLINPQHPITVKLIGAGGTGSQVITCLARLDATLVALEHPGLHVTVYDPDTVEPPNIGRQKFSSPDLGLNKAECLVTKVNAFFGLNWSAVPAVYPMGISRDAGLDDMGNIIITCTDNITSRYELSALLKSISPVKDGDTDYRTPLYWLDFGNTRSTRQVIVGTIPKRIKQPKSGKFRTVPSLPCITDLNGYDNLHDDDSGPSCSHAEALARQDLFMNSALAEFGSTILWRMLRQGYIEAHGLYLNLDTLTSNPIPV